MDEIFIDRFLKQKGLKKGDIVPFAIHDMRLASYKNSLPDEIEFYFIMIPDTHPGNFHQFPQKLQNSLIKGIKKEENNCIYIKAIAVEEDGETHYYELITGLEIPTVEFYCPGIFPRDKGSATVSLVPNELETVMAAVPPWDNKICWQNSTIEALTNYAHNYLDEKNNEGWNNNTFIAKFTGKLQSSYLNRNSFSQKEQTKEKSFEMTEEKIQRRIRQLQNYAQMLEEEEKGQFEEKQRKFMNTYFNGKAFPKEEKEYNQLLEDLIALEECIQKQKAEIDTALIEQALEQFNTAYYDDSEKAFTEFNNIISLLGGVRIQEEKKKIFALKITSILLHFYQTANAQELNTIIQGLQEDYLNNLINQTIPILKDTHDSKASLALLNYFQHSTKEEGKKLIKTAIELTRE